MFFVLANGLLFLLMLFIFDNNGRIDVCFFMLMVINPSHAGGAVVTERVLYNTGQLCGWKYFVIQSCFPYTRFGTNTNTTMS